MSYIETPADFPYPWYLRLMFGRQRRRYGREIEPVRLWARMPAAFLAMSAMYRALDRKSSPIEPALRSLVQVRISQINGCEFCVDLNSFLGLGRGTAESKLRELADFEDSPVFSERERAALAYAEAATRSDRRVDEQLMRRMRTYFEDQAIVEHLPAYSDAPALMTAVHNAGYRARIADTLDDTESAPSQSVATGGCGCGCRPSVRPQGSFDLGTSTIG